MTATFLSFRSPRPLRRDEKGATLVEFAFVAPIFCMLLVGTFDVGHTLYMRAVLQGVVQKAARDSSLENATETTRQQAIDDKITTSVHDLNRTATVEITRRFYKTFEEAAAARAENFTDTAAPSDFHDGTCNNNEPFEDANNNGVWDADGADDGQGGAKDVVVYTAHISYPRMLPLHNFVPAFSDTVSLTAKTVLQNQPYGEQSQYDEPTEGHCTP